MNNDKIVKELNGLLTKNYDAEKGYEKMADKTDNPVLKSYYLNKSSNRYMFGHQIKDLIKDLGGEPSKGTSTVADMHRTWVDVKTLFSFDKEEAILDEVELGEGASLSDYNDFLEMENIPSDVRRVINYQRQYIARSLRKADQLSEQLS